MLQRRISPKISNIQNSFRFREFLHTKWTQIPQNDMDYLILSRSNSCEAVLNNREKHTLY